MSFTRDELAYHPRFADVLGHLARGLADIYAESPRLARALASQQRWLLSQGAFALHLEHVLDNNTSGLTVSALKDLVSRTGAASRNTVSNFLDEMLGHRFVRYADVNERSKRRRRLEATDVSEQAMFEWLCANLAALDHLDGGKRASDLLAYPDLFRKMQPLVARACIASDGWREPSPQIAMFLWTEAGGLVVDTFMARLPPSSDLPERVYIGPVDTRAMADHFMMSRTHLQRLFRKAAALGTIGWGETRQIENLWISRDFLTEYCGWQAIKFSIVDSAYDQVAATIEEAEPPLLQANG